MEPSEMRPFLAHLARVSAEAILPLFADPDLKVELKADQTPVTCADRRAEEILRREIGRTFPDHGIIGEEFGETANEAEYTWVLDPIDGTKSFAAGSPLFGTLICLRQGTQPIWGAIHLPVTGQLFVGNAEAAWLGDRPLRLRTPPPLKECLLLTTDPKSPPLHRNPEGWQALLDATGMYRSWGDCFGYTMVARGAADIMCDPIMNLWDTAAILPVLRGAGAVATDWHGGDPALSDSLLVAHPAIHGKLLEILNPPHEI
ncbi:MAG: histidinol-phosphatase [Opitutales bacterium]|nr:histidinol-phosphatase [Opitutales bacterium]